MLPDLYIPKQSYSFPTEFPASSDVSLSLKFSAGGDVLRSIVQETIVNMLWL